MNTHKPSALVLAFLLACGSNDEIDSGVEAHTEEQRCADRYDDGLDNDDIASSTRLDDIEDTGGNYWVHDLRLGPEDVDWYVARAADHLLDALTPAFTLIEYSEEQSDAVTDHFELCAFSTLPAERVACQLGTVASYGDMAGCCAWPLTDNPEDVAELQMDIDSTLHDDTSEVFVRVRAADRLATNTCQAYELGGRGYSP